MTDGFRLRQADLTREAQYPPMTVGKLNKWRQQGKAMGCWVQMNP